MTTKINSNYIAELKQKRREIKQTIHNATKNEKQKIKNIDSQIIAIMGEHKYNQEFKYKERKYLMQDLNKEPPKPSKRDKTYYQNMGNYISRQLNKK